MVIVVMFWFCSVCVSVCICCGLVVGWWIVLLRVILVLVGWFSVFSSDVFVWRVVKFFWLMKGVLIVVLVKVSFCLSL